MEVAVQKTFKKLIKLIHKKSDFEKINISPILKAKYNKKLKDVEDEQLKEVVEDYIANHFFLFLKGCLYIFDREEISKDANFQTNDDDYKYSGKFQINTSLSIKGFSRIISVSIEDHGVETEDSDSLTSSIYGDWEVTPNISNFNQYTGDVLINGTFKGAEHSHIVFDNDYKIELLVEGLKNDSTHPSWAEYLIDGYLELKNGNDKNAFLNLFASTDYLINYLHELIFEFHLKQISSQGINDDLKKKIRLFSNTRQRLQDKLINIGKELNIDVKRMNCYKRWVEYTSIRDKIAHGGKFVCSYDLEDVLIDIITLIMTLLSGTNIEEKGWREIVK
ncbi:hypothetical protein [Priestia megaterium]|uniref:hypothetical protein n=1 Tax=Priestia megaterium TaxID=1404 RepID=UPI000BFA6F04|nr:hypothetical protein [Priestia megaterium]PFR94860.1 hypothetical protein COK39_15105 [Priestia megaterium]